MTRLHYSSEYAWKIAAFSLGYKIKKHGLRSGSGHSHIANNSFGHVCGKYIIQDIPEHQINWGYIDEEDLQLFPVDR